MIKQVCSMVSVGLVGLMAVSPWNGYKEIDVPKGEEYSAIICVVNPNENYTVYELDEIYIPCVNVYDIEDVIHLDKEGLNVGDTLVVTFEHDDVYEVEKISDYKLIVKN